MRPRLRPGTLPSYHPHLVTILNLSTCDRDFVLVPRRNLARAPAALPQPRACPARPARPASPASCCVAGARVRRAAGHRRHPGAAATLDPNPYANPSPNVNPNHNPKPTRTRTLNPNHHPNPSPTVIQERLRSDVAGLKEAMEQHQQQRDSRSATAATPAPAAAPAAPAAPAPPAAPAAPTAASSEGAGASGT